MFVSDRMVFLELHKTGCTHIRNILHQEIGGELIGKHNQATHDLFTRERKFIGSIRNPWDWYVSLWAYGCDKKGAIFNRATSESELRKIKGRSSFSRIWRKWFSQEIDEPRKWRDVYNDSANYNAFRDWLKLIHNYHNREILDEGYEYAKLSKFAGFLTFRYLKIFCCRIGENAKLQEVSSLEEMLAFEKSNCFVDYFIRNEHLESDLFIALEASGCGLADERKHELALIPRTNTSSRSQFLSKYYDADSLALVANREQLLIKKFNYQPPDICFSQHTTQEADSF